MTPVKHIVRDLLSAWRGRSPSPAPRRSRQAELSFDCLEGRVVLSPLGFAGLRAAHRIGAAQAAQTSRAGNLSTLGGRGLALHGGRAGSGGATQDAQLTQDLETLRTDQNAVLSGSSVTDAQRLALTTDLRSIATAGFQIDKTGLAQVADNLLAALADGSYDSNPATAQSIQTAFNALFTGSTVDPTLINQTYTDFVAVARSLNLNSTELTTLASDRAAIQADYTRLGITEHSPSSNLDLILAARGGAFHGACV